MVVAILVVFCCLENLKQRTKNGLLSPVLQGAPLSLCSESEAFILIVSERTMKFEALLLLGVLKIRKYEIKKEVCLK